MEAAIFPCAAPTTQPLLQRVSCRRDRVDIERSLERHVCAFTAERQRVIGAPVAEQRWSICRDVGQRHGLAPDDESGRAHALQLALPVADLADEAHNTHHPISGSLYYEDQKAEAKACAAKFCAERVPK